MLEVKKQFWAYQKQYVHDEHIFNSTTQSLEMPVSYDSLGYQIGASIFKPWDEPFQIIDTMKQADIPFSGILHGVDYMDRYKTFSVDTCEHRCSSSRPSQPSNCVDDVVKMAKQIQSEGFTYSLELNPTVAAEEGDGI